LLNKPEKSTYKQPFVLSNQTDYVHDGNNQELSSIQFQILSSILCWDQVNNYGYLAAGTSPRKNSGVCGSLNIRWLASAFALCRQLFVISVQSK
jgi:hypothetical protein